ncbi:hypothetical protein AgCh_017462 [Apium graveolens]
MVEMAHNLLKEKQMPSQFWGEAIRHAIYLLNRLPTRAVSGVTPYEEKPHIGHIRVFGCIAHMRIPSVNMQKLDNRSKRVVHLGKEPETKAYKLYDPVSKRVHVNKDIVFEETKSWVWEQEAEKKIRDGDNFVVLGMGPVKTRTNDTTRVENLTRNHSESNEEGSIKES